MNKEELEQQIVEVKYHISLGVLNLKQNNAKLERLEGMLEKQLEELNVLEVGWYREENDWLMYFDGRSFVYGFAVGGLWIDNVSCPVLETEIKATDKEVEEALIKEATRIGFKEGVIADTSNIDKEFRKNMRARGGEFKYSSIDNHLCIGYDTYGGGHDGNIIFGNGVWATIKEPTVTLEGEYTEEGLQKEIDKLKV